MRILLVLLLLILAPAAQAGQELTGRLLVASPDMPDNFFARSVVLILRHGEAGAFGVVVNRPGGETLAAHALTHYGTQAERDALARVAIGIGGPVEPMTGYMLVNAEDATGRPLLAGRFALRSAAAVLRDIGAGRPPRQALLLMGHSGWAPGQLEGEMARGQWIAVDADEELVFGKDHQSKWKRALGRRGVEL